METRSRKRGKKVDKELRNIFVLLRSKLYITTALISSRDTLPKFTFTYVLDKPKTLSDNPF